MEKVDEAKVLELWNEAGADNVLDSSIEREKTKKKKAELEADIEVLAKNFIEDPCARTFQPIYKRMFYGLRKYAYKYLQNLDDAEEMVLVTYEKIWTKYEQFNPEIAKFSTWVYNILRYECLGLLNRKAAQNYVNSDINDLFASTLFNDGNNCEMPSENFEVKGMDIRMLNREEIIQKVHDVSMYEISQLKPHLKLVITEKLVKGKKLEEVAEEQDIPVSSVKNYLRAARLEIRKQFNTKYKDLYDLYLDVAGEPGTYLC